MADVLFVDALQHALEKITNTKLPKDHYSTAVEMLNAFNAPTAATTSTSEAASKATK